MRRNRIFSLLLSFLLLVCSSTLPVRASQMGLPVTSGCHSVDAAMTLSPSEKKVETSKAVVLYERNSDTMLYAWNPDEKIYPTSMVKMMTALIAIENGNLDEEVTVTRKVLDQLPIGTVSAGLKAGEKITLKDLLYCCMVQSANDATVVIANHIGGTAEEFVLMMNDKAQELGCKNTSYSNVHGLHDENTYTTARDICRLTEVALENEIFRTMFQTVTYTIPATNKSAERTITTTNHMMNPKNKKYYDERVTGGKTGATDQGGRCLALTAQANGMDILCIVMGAKPTVAEDGTLSAHGSFEECLVLLNEAFASYEYRQVFFQGQSLAQYPVAGGANDVVTQAATSISSILPVDADLSQLRWVYQPTEGTITAPVEQGQKLGIAQAWYGDKCLAQTDMIAMNRAEVFQAPVVPEKPNNNRDSGSWTALLIVLLGALGVFAAIIFTMRGIRIVQIKMRRRRRQRRKEGRG